ncbi:MAG: type II toxin-antitoxin system VapC family toxin [Chloroflexaceae bacterium]|nr:type II toxin-antitoxin system VapC family toxin [Chloroflexaceae bacterium]
MKARLIDANIILRFLLGDDAGQSPRCHALFARVEQGHETVYLPEVALSDVIWTLRSYYKWPKPQIKQFVLALLAMEALTMQRKAVVLTAISFFCDYNVDFSDALIAAEGLELGLVEVYTFDKDFKRLPGIVRCEPEE